MPLKRKDQFEAVPFHAVIQEPIISYFLKAVRQYMQKKPAYELLIADCDLPFGVARLFASGRKNSLCFGYGQNAAVRNGNLMGIPAQIFDCIAKSIESLFDVGAPVQKVQLVPELLPFIRIPEFFAGRGKNQCTALIKRVQQSHVFPPEFIAEDMDRDKKVTAGCTYCVVCGKSAP